MAVPDAKAPALVVWALGTTQVVGYGTLYYSFAILAPSIAAELGFPQQWAFGALSVALFLGSLLAPTAGRLADRLGAGRVMAWGSGAAALAFVACAAAPEAFSFAAALVLLELAACFVLYSTAFVAIVQIGPANAQRSITHLTLIAGFASTLFWPLTTALHDVLGWREVYLVFAALNLLVCLPIHAWLARFGGRGVLAMPAAAVAEVPAQAAAPDETRRRALFLLMMAGFAIEGFVLSAILLHMVPLLVALGLGTAGVIVSTFFGPAQVASRLVNMVFGGRLPQVWLAVIAAMLLPAGLAIALAGAPGVVAVALFVILYGMGSGLVSIIGGTLPLEVFGRDGYGASVGWMSAARQFSSSFAPFALAAAMAATSVKVSLSALLVVALGGVAVFLAIALVAGGRRRKT